MLLKNWWEREIKIKILPKLSQNLSTEYLVVGAGVAGLHAALYLANKGKGVILLEKSYCGSSSSGKSSGFLTPTSELDVSTMINRYGLKNTKIIWEIPVKGVSEIVDNIKEYKIKCDFEAQDCLYLGLGDSGKKDIEKEVKAHKKMRLPYRYYARKNLKSVINTGVYSAGIQTKGTYSINAFLYCMALKKILLKKGVKIFENSEVLNIVKNKAYTSYGYVKAKKMIICVDKMKKTLSQYSKKIYHAQTFLLISRPLTKKEIKRIFPRKKLMCWDSKLVYSYFRVTKDNRLLLGGSSQIAIYSPKEWKSSIIPDKLIAEFKRNFPRLKDLKFESYWSGLIDIAKDIMPIVDLDSKNKNIQYVLGNPGLPWAANLGTYAAKRASSRKADKRYQRFIGANRKFFVSDTIQGLIGKIPAFAINNLFMEYWYG